MIELSLLGGVRLGGGDPERLAGLLSQPKRVALLAYLTLARPRGFQSRDTLLALFWPELDGRHARWALNQAVRHLRQALGGDAVRRRGHDVAVDPTHLNCDAIDLEAACAAARWDDALELYRGELLPGLRPGGAAELDQWVDGERERLRNLAAQAATARSEALLAAGDLREAGSFAREARRLAPDDETRVRRLMELLAAAGDRAGAARVYDDYASWLKSARDLAPAPETRSLLESLQAGHRVLVAPVAPPVLRPSEGDGESAPARATATPSGSRRARLLATLGVAGVVAGAGVLLALLLTPNKPPPIPLFGRSVRVTSDPGLEIQPALSPDGRFVAYASGDAARMRIYIRPIGGGRTIPLSDDSTAVEYQPRWSPDGNQLLYLARGGVWLAPPFGGTGHPIAGPAATGHPIAGPAAPVNVRAAAWSPDGNEIVFVRGDSILITRVQGAATRPVSVVPMAHSCAWSPDGRWIACVVENEEAAQPGFSFGNVAPSTIVLFPAAGGMRRPVTDSLMANQSPVWSPEGRRLFFISNREGSRDVFVQELTSGGEARGTPSRVTTGLNAQSLSISADGARLAYDVFVARSNIWSLPIPVDGVVTAGAATQVTTGNQYVEAARPSRDGTWVVYDSDLRGNGDIYRVPLAGGAPQQLTNEAWDEFAPDLSPDGRLLAYHSFRTGSRDIEVKPLDGSPVERVTDSPRQESFPRWSPDGGRLLFFDQQWPIPIMVSTRVGPGRWSIPDTIAYGLEPQWSPDGRDIAFLGPDSASHGRSGAVVVVSLVQRAARTVYTDRGSARQIGVADAGFCWASDGRMYVKTHDLEGHAFIWEIAEGCSPRLLVRFMDLNRPSSRQYFAADRARFYFTFDERESDVFVADLMRR